MFERKDKWTVGEWMTSNPHTVTPEQPVRHAFVKMRVENIRHLPVVEDDKLVGMVTDRDLRRPDLTGEPEGWHDYYRLDGDYEVGDVMTTPVETVRTATSVEEALGILLEKKYGALPVVDKQGDLIGILSVYDLLGAFSAALETVGEDLRRATG